MLLKEWKINKSDENKPLIQRLLSGRGIKSQKEIDDFINPLEIKLTHPNAFCDMQKSVDRIISAINNKENILIYGDFDADGLTSTSVMFKTLSYLGANVSYYIPTRETDGHGLNSDVLVKLLLEKKPKLIITVDCGISNIKEVDFINSFKIDIIITDHHEQAEELPKAFAIINPKAQNALNEKLTSLEIKYLTSLSGVGVAFKIAQALLEKYEKLIYIYELLPLVAVGTIADVVPLIGENRYYVLKGLDLISKDKHYGLKLLLSNAGYTIGDKGITSEQVAFGIAPRINACGRLDAVDYALKLLISENKQEIELSAVSLENFNKIRQELCQSTFIEADEMAKSVDDNVIVLYKKDWHIGIIGIVASKLVEKYHKPVFLMTYSDETKQIRCSARSVEGVSQINLHDIISNVSEKLDGFGGHQLAAGLSFKEENIKFVDVKKGLSDSIKEALNGEEIVPTLNIDLEIDSGEISVDMIEELSKLEPYGASNPSPLFVTNNFILKDKKLMGANKDHLKLVVEHNGQTFNAIWWSKGDIPISKGDSLDIVYCPQINIYNNNISIQLIIKDIHSDSIKEDVSDAIKIYDHRNKTNIEKQVNDYLKTTKMDVLIYAEEKDIIEQLKPYTEISSRIVNRNQIRKSDVIMFYDYPPSENIYKEIVQKASPKVIHYMNYKSNKNIENIIKVLQGMIRFVCNNKDGYFNLNDSAVFLGLTTDFVTILINLLSDMKMIKILDFTEDYYKLELIEHALIKSIEEIANFDEISSRYTYINDFKQNFMDDNINLTELNIL